MCVDGSTIWAERVDRHLVGGQWIEIPIMGIVEFDSAGKMTLMRDYFDSRLAL
jgi:limonene-1,2-epoxide hydrolase